MDQISLALRKDPAAGAIFAKRTNKYIGLDELIAELLVVVG